MAYSKDYKERAVAYKQEGHTFKKLREAFGIPSDTYYKWEKRLASGYYDITIKRERKRKINKAALTEAVGKKPDAYLSELGEPFGCTATAVFYALKKLNITRKKRPTPTAKNLNTNERRIRHD